MNNNATNKLNFDGITPPTLYFFLLNLKKHFGVMITIKTRSLWTILCENPQYPKIVFHY